MSSSPREGPSPTQGSSISFHTANGSKLAGTPYQTPRSPANIRGTSVTTIEVRSFGSSRPSTSQTTSQTKQIANQSAQTSPRKGRGRAGVRGRSQASAARAPTPTHHLGPGQGRGLPKMLITERNIVPSIFS